MQSSSTMRFLMTLDHCFCFDVKAGSLLFLWGHLFVSEICLVFDTAQEQYLGIICHTLTFFCSLFGIYAVEKKKSNYFIPFLLAYSITAGINLVNVTWEYLYHIKDGGISKHEQVAASLCFLFVAGYQWYVMSVIYSFYVKLKRGAYTESGLCNEMA